MTPHPTVCIVDDDAAVRAAMSLLVQSCGWEPSPHACAEDFLKHLTGATPACLILDLRMPGMTGPELLERLAELGIDLPVIVVTAYPDHPLAARARSAGATAVLAKPVRDADLIRHIEAALHQPPHPVLASSR